MVNPMDLTGRRILVTGASSGLGREISILANRLGASVIMVARRQDKLADVCKQLDGGHNRYYAYDLKNISGIEELIAQIVSENGVLDGLVHSAGIANIRPLSDTTYGFLHDMMLVNFYSFVELARVYAKKKNNAGGSIVAISSISGKLASKSKMAYCASKSALEMAAKVAATELAKKNIRVNSVLPSFIETDMYRAVVDDLGEEFVKQHHLSRQLLGLGQPIDVANATAFLLSDASRFITASDIAVDGGYL